MSMEALDRMTVVREYPAQHAPGLLDLLPDESRSLFRASGDCAFRLRPHGGTPCWEWCFTGVQRAAYHPQFVSLCHRSRGAWDESQEVLYDTACAEYVVSVRAYADAFTPDTVVRRARHLHDAMHEA